MKYFKQLTIYMLIAGLFFVSSNAWSKKTETAEKNVPQIISSPTIPYPEGVDPADFSEQFDVQEYEQDELNLNNVYVICGDSVVDEYEECDDGNRTMGDGCSDLCFLEDALACGNRQIDPGETCDDGNKSSNDGCSPSCQLESICGNGKTEGSEECDDGNQKAGDGCSVKCMKENIKEEEDSFCGDGVKDSGEECDDRNQKNGDGCSSSCKKETGSRFCGDGVKDSGEECDDGNQKNYDGCSSQCKREIEIGVCGDGVKNSDEECDDGNLSNGDGCSSICFIERILPPVCIVDSNKLIPTYDIKQAKVSPLGCKGSCTVETIKDNCGNIVKAPTWKRSENKISSGTYIGLRGVEVSCETGQATGSDFIRGVEIGEDSHQKATILDCEF